MMRVSGIVLVQLASLASLVGLYLTVVPWSADRPGWHWGILAVAIVLSAIACLSEINDYMKSRPRKYSSSTNIARYMKNWVSSNGRTVIFSRDLSWVGSGKILEVLCNKSIRKELTVFLEHETELSNKLALHGANVITYGHLGHVPRSRFTIIGYERDGARVAVGAQSPDGKHQIQEFQMGTHPCYALAEDLVKLLQASQALQK